MGVAESADAPPLPSQSQGLLYVIHNGQYYPQYMVPLTNEGGRGFDRGFRPPKPPELKRTTLLKNPVNVLRETVAVTGTYNNPLLQFCFDSTCEALMSISVVDADAVISTRYPAKMRRQISVGLALIGPALSQLTQDGEVTLCVELSVDGREGVRAQKTIISVTMGQNAATCRGYSATQQDSDLLHANVISQSVELFTSAEDTVYKIQEVFGLKSGTDCGRDCIICMSEPKNTVILPCRHMAFCSGCAPIMRSRCEKCPICRQRVVTLVEFSLSEDLTALTADTQSPGHGLSSSPSNNETR